MTPEPFFDRDLSRRAFLGGGLVVTGGLVAAASLGTAAFAASSSAKKLAPLVLSSDLYVSDQPQRLVVALARGGKSGIQFVSGPAAQFRFQPPKTPGGATPTATPWVKAPLDRAGLPKGRGVYVTSPVLDTAGVWDVEVKAQGESVPFKIQVNAAAVAPVVGQPAPRAASPTVTDTLGVSPICTRQPACPLHTVSLASVIGAGKPVEELHHRILVPALR